METKIKCGKKGYKSGKIRSANSARVMAEVTSLERNQQDRLINGLWAASLLLGLYAKYLENNMALKMESSKYRFQSRHEN